MNLVGRRLGPYRLIREIGRGGMAVVYLGYHDALRQHVAVKVLLPHLTHDPTFLERFQREARVIARLRHPNIVRVHTIDHEGDLHYLVMEYADAGTLQQRLQEGRPLRWGMVVEIARQVAAALDYAHKQGIVHRDVKPSNILLNSDGRAILTDFGIARVTEESRLTLTGGYLGTPEYMAPEQVTGKAVGPGTDVYALGTVVYQAATGHPPFRADTPIAVLHHHAYEPPPPPRQLNPGLPPSAEAAILMALAKDPNTRFASAGAFANALTSRHVPAARPGVRSAVPAAVWALGVLPLLGILIIAVAILPGVLKPGPDLPTPLPTDSATVVLLPTDTLAPLATETPLLPTLPPLPTPAASDTSWAPMPTADPFQNDIQELLLAYRELKAIAIGRTHDVSQLSTILRGEALRELENAVSWQRDHGAYYETTWHWMRIEWLEQTDSTHAQGLVTYNETLLYYPEGWTTPSAKRSCDPCEYQGSFVFEWIDGYWYIVDKDTID